MAFEVMGDNLLSLIKRHDYRGIPLELVKVITLQTLIGLNFLHSQCQIIHTDLKPENFLLANIDPLNLKAIQAERKAVVERENQVRLEKSKLMLAQQKLNKNQKKRLKAKLKKEAEKVAGIDSSLTQVRVLDIADYDCRWAVSDRVFENYRSRHVVNGVMCGCLMICAGNRRPSAMRTCQKRISSST